MSNEKKHKIYEYASDFSGIISQFIAEKRNMGFLYDTEARHLVPFDRHLAYTASSTGQVASREVIESYIAKRDYESVRNHQARYLLVKQLCEYMKHYEYDVYAPPPLPKRENRSVFVPHIFSHVEIQKLLDAADTLPYCEKSPFRHIVFQMIFRLLYNCGLRCSEAKKLKISDVDLNKGILTIRSSKFQKDRLVPMSKSLTEYAQKYINKIRFVAGYTEHFLPSPKKKEYKEKTIYNNFRLILFRAGISHGGRGNGPRAHDLRHTFAVHCLQRWAENGVDIRAALP